jgi:hypothetical protein
VAEWLGRGLQSLVQQFDSAPRLDFAPERNVSEAVHIAQSSALRSLELACEGKGADHNQDGRDPDERERRRRRYEERRDRSDDNDGRNGSKKKRESELSAHETCVGNPAFMIGNMLVAATPPLGGRQVCRLEFRFRCPRSS